MISPVTWVRSWLYLVTFLAWCVIAGLGFLPLLVTRRTTLVAIRGWARGIMVLARVVAGIRYTAIGREQIPAGPFILAAQHQAAYETFRVFLEVPRPILVLKRELTWIPVIGWYMHRAGLIAVDRSAGAGAMRKMLRAADEALARGDQLVIFPEGTRVPPGESWPYQPGIAALYSHCQVPVVPMALNSGVLWGKTRILKCPGRIVFRFLPPLPEGLSKRDMLDQLRANIEGADLSVPEERAG
jgi:1-acyl-sn-glycerol-3-phosphate acyltransferase